MSWFLPGFFVLCYFVVMILIDKMILFWKYIGYADKNKLISCFGFKKSSCFLPTPFQSPDSQLNIYIMTFLWLILLREGNGLWELSVSRSLVFSPFFLDVKQVREGRAFPSFLDNGKITDFFFWINMYEKHFGFCLFFNLCFCFAIYRNIFVYMDFYAPLEKGGILFFNCRSVSQSVGL